MIKINGKYIRNIPEQVGKNKRDIFQLDTDLSALEVKVNEALAGVFHYKGSVSTYADLPASDNEVGDVYNVIDTGKNYAWDGSAWDDLGGLVDLSNYVTLDTEQTISGHKTFSSLEGISSEMYSGMDYSRLALHGDEGVYITTGTSYRFVDIQGDLDPNVDNTYNLGSSHSWKNLSLSGVANLSNTASEVLKLGTSTTYANLGISSASGGLFISGGGSVVIDQSVRPHTNNARDLGSSSYGWKDAHIAGVMKTNDINTFSSTDMYVGNSSGVVNVRSTFRPYTNNSRDLGSSSLKWKDFYVAGNISNGTDSVTVEDLAALITYAKAQGWIS